MEDELEITELTKTSSKGQIVIPSSTETAWDKRGSVFSIAARKNIIVLKKLDTRMKA